jgi:hypothetical protein
MKWHDLKNEMDRLILFSHIVVPKACYCGLTLLHTYHNQLDDASVVSLLTPYLLQHLEKVLHKRKCLAYLHYYLEIIILHAYGVLFN